MINISEYILTMSQYLCSLKDIVNKKKVDLYQNDSYLHLKIDDITTKKIRGIKLEGDTIITQILIKNNFIYLPDVEFNVIEDLVRSIINRDRYIQSTLDNIPLDKKEDFEKTLQFKKNLDGMDLNNLIIYNKEEKYERRNIALVRQNAPVCGVY